MTPFMSSLEDFQNPLKVFHHSDRIAELQATGDTRPVHMTIGLTNYCNHACPWCYIEWKKAGPLSMLRSGHVAPQQPAINAPERLIEAVGEAKELGLKAVTIVGDGEPTLHPRFVAMLERLAALGLDIGIFSNLSTPRPDVIGSMLRNCFFVRGSIDAATAETHRITHGADDWGRVMKNIQHLVNGRHSKSLRPERPILGVQFVVNQWNWWEIVPAATLFRGMGVDYITYKPAYKNSLNPAHAENEVDMKQAFALMREAQGLATETFKVYAKFPQFVEVLGESKTNDARYYKVCQATPLSPYLDEDGNVEMCGNLKGRGFTMGNVYQESFAEIWNGQQRKDCIAKIDLFQCPAGCKLHGLNQVLWDAIHPDEKRVHPNFI